MAYTRQDLTDDMGWAKDHFNSVLINSRSKQVQHNPTFKVFELIKSHYITSFIFSDNGESDQNISCTFVIYKC